MAFFGKNKNTGDDDIDWITSPDDDNEPKEKQFRKRVTRETRGNIVRWELAAIVIILLGIFYYVMNPVKSTIVTPGTDLDPMGKTQAWALTEEWLKDKPLGDDARIVSWNGSTGLTMMDGSKPFKVRVHKLIVDSALGWWQVDTTVRDDGELAEFPSPTRIEVPNAASPNSSGAWSDTLQDLTPSEAVDTLVTKWGQALIGDDNDLLTVVMKDPDPNAEYQSLALGTANSVSTGKGAYLNRGKVDRNDNVSDMAVVRATILMNGRDQNSKQTSIGFDLLIQDPDGSPRILAWGAPGTGPTLKEYSNRVSGKPVDMTNQDGNGVTGGNSGGVGKTTDTGAAAGGDTSTSADGAAGTDAGATTAR